MTPLERAANAIEHEFVELADPYGKVSPYGIAHRVARAVLAAIREPSEGMLKAGVNAPGAQYVAVRLQGQWEAMIDHALTEEPK